MSDEILRPGSPEELAAAIAEAANLGEPIETGGYFTKQRLGGPIATPSKRISTRAIDQVLAYEPADLTIKVGAGMCWSDLAKLLDDNGQALPLDPPFEGATVGGALGADLSGPRRRRYGTARDLVIGMQFVPADGKIVASGGMVVKNVTGLDMAKLLIGSMGTLGVIATANFKVFPKPELSATFAFLSDSSDKLVAIRSKILQGAAQPTALDLLNGPCGQGLAVDFGSDFVLLAEATGSEAVVQRSKAAYEAFAQEAEVEFVTPEPSGGEGVWRAIRSFHPSALEACSQGLLLRISTTASGMKETLALLAGMAPEAWVLSRAANAVIWCALPDADAGARLLERLRKTGVNVLVESAPEGAAVERWAAGGTALEAMRRVKNALDPANVLNPGRLWGKI